MPDSLRVTLVITTYNWPAALDLTLQSVARQSVAPTEIIVADDGSGPETEEVVTRWQERLPTPLVHVWQADEGFRLARSRNRAIAAARGDYVIIVDGDMVLHRHFIADHVRAARHGCFIQGVRLLTGPKAAGPHVGSRPVGSGVLCARHQATAPHRPQPAAEPVGVSVNAPVSVPSGAATRLLEERSGSGERLQRGLRRVGPRRQRDCGAAVQRGQSVRRNLKFQALAIHLHHPLRHTQMGSATMPILRATIEQRKAWCPMGLNQHLDPPRGWRAAASAALRSRRAGGGRRSSLRRVCVKTSVSVRAHAQLLFGVESHPGLASADRAATARRTPSTGRASICGSCAGGSGS